MKVVICVPNVKFSKKLLYSPGRLSKQLCEVFNKYLSCSASLSGHQDVETTSSIELSVQHYEKLWQEQDLKLQNNFTRDEFKFVIKNLFSFSKAVSRTINFDHTITKSVYSISKQLIHPATREESQINLVEKLKASSENWSVIFNNLWPVVSLVTSEFNEPTSNKQTMRKQIDRETLINSFYAHMFTGFSQLQSDSTMTKIELFSDLNDEMIDLEKLKLNSELLLTYIEYLRQRKPDILNSQASLRHAIRVCLLYVDFYLLINKKTLKKVDSKIEPFLRSAITMTRQLMTQFNGLDSIHHESQSEFFRFFSFDELLWLKSSEWLKKTIKIDMISSFENLFTSALRGKFFFCYLKYFLVLLKFLFIFLRVNSLR